MESAFHVVAGTIKEPPPPDRYSIALGLLESVQQVQGGHVVSVPAWLLHELRAALAGQGEQPRLPSVELSGREVGNLGRMLQSPYVSDLERESCEETGLRLAARALLEAIALRCLDGQTDGQVLSGIRCSDELRRMVVAVRLAQEEWTW